jgi:hypothetical protein
MAVDPTSMIVAGTGLVATLLGWRQWRQGRTDQQIQQQAANKLQRDQLQLEEYRALLPDLRIEADRARAQRDEARREAEAERNRRVEAETAQRLAAHEASKRDEALRAELRRRDSDVSALRMIVHDEIARAAADTAYPDLPRQQD